MNTKYNVLENFVTEDHTRLFLFATGNSQVPITGFKYLQRIGNIRHFIFKKNNNKKWFIKKSYMVLIYEQV